MNDAAGLPPGQFELNEFPRFGLGRFANRFPDAQTAIRIAVRGDVERELLVTTAVLELTRCEQVADFHCVTTWSCLGLRWSGFRFAEFYHHIVAAEARPHEGATLVVFRAGDGYCTSLPLADLLARDVMLADRLHGQPLDLEHGAPLRLVAPAHYGYKNVKHLAAIEFWRDRRAYRFPPPYPGFMDHPRARVAFEERGTGVPAWLLRLVYRPLIRSTIRNFRRGLATHLADSRRAQ